MRSSITPLAVLVGMAVLFGGSTAQAGCGCEKPAPAPADVRPRVTHPGAPVTFFGSGFVPGTSYQVAFKNGIAKVGALVTGTAVLARDLADGQMKPQLVVPLPAMPPGPATISITAAGGRKAFLTISDSSFTVAPAPVQLSDDAGKLTIPNVAAAVSRSGVVYLSLDLTGIHQPRVFEVQMRGYPLTFGSKDVIFYNRQGFLMQTLGDGMPGLFTISQASTDRDSDVLRYSRHEFNTYFLQHEERQPHPVDPGDPNWHLDGTPHIDHDHLIVAIVGLLRDGTAPVPGASPLFDLALDTYTVFHHGLVGQLAVTLEGSARTDSYDSATGEAGHRGDVRSNGIVDVGDEAVVDGNATGTPVLVEDTAVVTGASQSPAQAVEFLPVAVPKDIPDLGAITVAAGTTFSLPRGSYRLDELIVEPTATLHVENVDGPVTLYVAGMVVVGGTVTTADANPENFALYGAGSQPVVLNGDADFHGVVHAPESLVDVSGLGEFHGAFVGASVDASADAAIHYDTSLRGTHETSGIADTDPGTYPIDPWDPLPVM